MSLETSQVSKSLERKLILMGFEVPDLLALLILLSILQFLFGSLGQNLLLVWLPVSLLAITLRIGKRGKPDNYLLHLVQYSVRPKYFSAFTESKIKVPLHIHKKI